MSLPAGPLQPRSISTVHPMACTKNSTKWKRGLTSSVFESQQKLHIYDEQNSCTAVNCSTAQCVSHPPRRQRCLVSRDMSQTKHPRIVPTARSNFNWASFQSDRGLPDQSEQYRHKHIHQSAECDPHQWEPACAHAGPIRTELNNNVENSHMGTKHLNYFITKLLAR